MTIQQFSAGQTLTAAQMNALQESDFNYTVNTQSGTSYTLLASDLGKMIKFTNSGSVTLTVPTDASVSFNVGDRITLMLDSTGTLTVAGASGVTVNSEGSIFELNTRYSIATLVKLAANSWILTGVLMNTITDSEVTTAKINDGAVTSAKIADGTIVNADINASAAIALSKLASGTSAQVVIANASGVPTYTTLSGDVQVSNAGVVTIQPNSVALGTDTTGNYMADVTAGTGVTVTHTPGEGSNATIAIGQSVATSASVTFAQVTAPLVGNASTATSLQTARTISLGGDVSGSASFDGTSNVTITATVQPDSVALGTDTTGNYVASLVAGTGITITNNTGEGATPTIAVTSSTYQPLDAELTALAGTTSAADALPYFTGAGTATTTTLTSAARSLLDDASVGAIRTTLGVGTADSPVFAGATIDAVQVGITAAGEIDTTTGNLTIDSAGGTVTIDDNLVVSGDLTINGTTTTVNTATLNVSDNIVVLNNDVTGSPTENAGIEVERGTSTNVLVRWNETNDKWELTNDGTTYGNIVTTADSGTVTSTMIADGTIVNADISSTAAIDIGKIADVTIDTKTANYTLALTDKNKFIEMNLSSANTVSVPTNASVAFPIGSQIHITQYGTGKTQIVAVTPATTNIRSTPGAYLRAQYSSATLIKRATDEWYLVGDLSAT